MKYTILLLFILFATIRSFSQNTEEAHFDEELVAVLDQIYFDDQNTRNKIRSTEEQFGRESKEMDALWQDILKKDAINLIKVSKILEEKGWPDKKSMEGKNLPKRQYAMFYDRLLLRQGKRQIYGTQLAMSKERTRL